MRRHSMITAVLAIPLLLTGCMRQTATKAIRRADFSSVAVRFALPGEGPQYSLADAPSHAQLVVDRGYRGLQDGSFDGASPTVPTEARHVALWGQGFDGTDITKSVTSMKPGSYMFAFIDPAYSKMIQGWVEVNYTDYDMLDILQKWRNGIPRQKQQLAVDFDARGRMDGNNPGTFQNFANELAAFDRLEERINQAINAELAARGRRHLAVGNFLKNTELLLLPGEDEVFRKTTRAAFTEDDLAGVRAGDALTKIILVADYKDTQWKLNHVNRLYNDLTRAKVVLKGVVDRLERRQGMLLLTDHLHNHDGKFLRNEQQLQYAVGEIERMDKHMAGLRERRMALAFISELVAPESNFFALDREHADLIRERRVVEAEMKQLDVTLEATREENPKRIAIERSRQHASASMAAIDSQLIDLEQARTALEMMTDTTDIIHRQGDKRLLASTFVGQQLPFRVREAIENEALMTVRLEGSEKVFVPAQVQAPSAVTASNTTFQSPTANGRNGTSVKIAAKPAKASKPRRTVTTGKRRPTATKSSKTSKTSSRLKTVPLTGTRTTQATSPKTSARPAHREKVKTNRKMVTPGKRVAAATKPTAPTARKTSGSKARKASSKNNKNNKSKPAPKMTAAAKRKMVTPGRRVATATKPIAPTARKTSGSKTRKASSKHNKSKPAPKMTAAAKRKMVTPGKRVATATKPIAPTPRKASGSKTRKASSKHNKSKPAPKTRTAAKRKMVTPGKRVATATKPSPSTKRHTPTNKWKRSGPPSPTASKRSGRSTTKARTTSSRSGRNRRDNNDAKVACELPLFVKLLVPPCWFADDLHNNTRSAGKARNGNTRRAASAKRKPVHVNRATKKPRRAKKTSWWAKKPDSPLDSARKNRARLTGFKNDDRNFKNNKNNKSNKHNEADTGKLYIVVLMTALDDYPVLVTADAKEARRFANQEDWVTQTLSQHARKQAGRDQVRLSGVGIWNMVDGDPQSFELVQRFDSGKGKGFDARKFSPLVFQPAKFGRKRK